MMSTLFTRTAQTLVGLVCFFVVLGVPLAAAQQVPEVITYQGTLADADGNPVADPVDLTFRFFDAESDGAPLPGGEGWSESYTGVPVTNGRFSVPLGSQTPLPDGLFDNRQQLWLEVAVNGETLPRMRMASTAFAREAQSVVTGAIGADELAGGTAVRRLQARASDDSPVGDALTDDVAIKEGDNVTLTVTDNVLTISAVAPDGGLSSVAVAPPLTGDGTSANPVALPDESIAADQLAGGAAVRGLNVRDSDNTSLGVLTDTVAVQEGDNVTLDVTDDVLTISAVAPDGGLSSVAVAPPLTGDGTSDNPVALTDGGISAAQLADSLVTGDKLANGTVVRRLTAKTESGATITTKTDDLTFRAGNNVTLGEQAGEITISAVGPDGGLSSVSSDQTLVGNGTADQPLGIANNAVTSARILDGQVQSSDLSTDAVSTAKILDDAVTASKIDDAAAVKSLNSFVGSVTVTSSDNTVGITSADGEIDLSLSSDAAVTQLNNLTGGLSLIGGANVSITDNGADQITISSTDTGITSVASDATLAGDGTTDSELGIAENGVGRTELASDVVVDQLNGLVGGVTIATAGGASISTDESSNTITINAGSGGGGSEIESISNTDGALDVTNSAGSVTINVADGGISTADLADNAVTGGVIQDGSIQGADLADAAVGPVQLGDDAVTAAKLADGSVSTAALQNSAVTSAQINDGSVTSADLATGSVGSAEVQNGAISQSDLATDAAALGSAFPSANTLRGTVALAEGTNVSITDNGTDQITISAASTGLTSVATDANKITGDGTAGGELSLAENAVTGFELANDAVGSDALAPNTAVTLLEIQNNGGATTGPFRDAITLNGGSNVTLSEASGAITIDATDTGLLSVATDGSTIAGDGTSSANAVRLADGGVTAAKLSPAVPSTSGQVLGYDGTSLVWTSGASGDITAVETLGGSGLTGGASSGSVSLSIADGGVTGPRIAGTAIQGSGAITVDNSSGNFVVSTSALTSAVTSITADGTTLADDITLQGSDDISVTSPSSGVFEIDFTGSTSGAVTSVSGGAGIDADQTTGDVTLSIGSGNITGAMLGGSAVQGGTNVQVTRDGSDNVIVEAPNALTSAVTSLTVDGTALTDDLTLQGGSNVTVSQSSGTITIDATGSTGVESLEGATGSVTLSGDVTGSNSDANTVAVTLNSDVVNSATVANNTLTADDLATGSVNTDELAGDAVTTTQILDETITGADVSDGSISASDLATNSVASDELAAGATVTSITAGASTLTDGVTLAAGSNVTLTPDGGTNTITIAASGGSEGITSVNTDATLTGNGDTTPLGIADDAINSARVADNTLAAADLATGSVTSDEILDGTITANDLGADAVTAAALADGAVDAPAIQSNAVTTVEIADDTIAPADIDGSLGTDGQALITDGTNVAWGDISATVNTDGTTITGDGSSTTLSVGAIGSGQITDGSITSTDISDGTVAPVDLSSTAATADQALIFNGADVVWGNPSATVTSDGTTITGDGSSTALSIPAGGVGETQIATGAVGSDEVALNALTADDLASASVTTDEIEDGTVANVDLADDAVSAASLSAGSPTDNFVLTYDSGEADSLRWGDPSVLASSIRWKENVRTLDDALSLVKELRGVRYDWTESGEADVGVIAEEVAAVLPELVAFEADGQARGVHYAKLVAVLIEATKAQQTELETKEQTIARQQEEIDAMKQRMDRLERLVQQVAAEDGPQ